MKREFWEVGNEAIRPITKMAGKDECTYCGVPRGGQHLHDCVIRERTVVIRATFEYVVTVPEHWTKEDIEFHRNEGSWCSSNAISELEGITEHNCLCGCSQFEFLREATEADQEAFNIYVDEVKS